jgi:hypothetical protein
MNFFKLSEVLETFDTNVSQLKFTGFTDEKVGAIKYRAPTWEEGGEREEVVSVADVEAAF